MVTLRNDRCDAWFGCFTTVRMKGLVFMLFTVLFLWPAEGDAQHAVPRSVMGAGGAPMTGSGHAVNGTLSQTSIGLIERSQGIAGIGFWYKAVIKNVNADIVVLLPHVEEYANKVIDIPLILAQQRRLISTGAKTFDAVIKVKRSLLYPVDAT